MSLNVEPLVGKFHTDLTVGDILRRARLKKNLSIQDIEIAVRISAQHITAIEEGRLEVLPGRTYALGFIRAYAEYVDLDGERVLSLLKQQSGEKIAPRDLTPKNSAISEDFSLPTGKVFFIIFFLLCTTLVFKSYYTGQNYLSSEDIPEVPLDLKKQTTLLSKPEEKVAVKEITVSEQAQPAPEVQPASNTNQIVLKAIENVWLEIRDSSKKTVFSRVLAVGEEYWVPLEQTDLVMTLGNAGGLQISVGAETLPFLGKTGQVIRKLSLNPENLKEILKKSL